MVKILHLDHLVLTVADLDASIAWYTSVLSMKLVTFQSSGIERQALAFGNQKINLHPAQRQDSHQLPGANPGYFRRRQHVALDDGTGFQMPT